MSNLATILREAKALIGTPEKWCQGAIGHTLDGTEIYHPGELDKGVIGRDYCAFGSIRAVTRNAETAHEANHLLSWASVGSDEWPIALYWNNDPETSHDDVMAAFDRAIEAAQ